MKPENYFSADEFQRIWKEEFLILSIRQEIKEMQMLKASIGLIKDRCDTLEKSQDLISNKYDTLVRTLQNVKEQATKLDKKYKEITCSLKAKQAKLVDTTDIQRHKKKISARDCRKSNKIR